MKKVKYPMGQKIISVLLSVIMLGELSASVIAAPVSLNKEDKNKLSQVLSDAYEKSSYSDKTSNQNLKTKMENDKRKWAVALVKYQMALALQNTRNQVISIYNDEYGKIQEIDDCINQEKSALYEKFDPESDKYEKFYQKYQYDNSWRKEFQEQYAEAQDEQEKQELLYTIKYYDDYFDTGASWDKEKATAYKEEFLPRVKAFDEYEQQREELINTFVDRFNDDDIKSIIAEHNQIISDVYGTTMPEGLQLKGEDIIEQVESDKYQKAVDDNIAVLENQYNIAAANYEKASNEYYDDLLRRYAYYDSGKLQEQCARAQKSYEKRVEGKQALDEYGWTIIDIHDKRADNYTPSGIKQSLFALYNTCATGKAIVKEKDLNGNWDGLKSGQGISPEEYVDVKFYTYYEDYVPESEKIYNAQIVPGKNDSGLSKIYPAYYVKENVSSDREEGKKRGREIFMLLLANNDFGYALYRASVVDEGLAREYAKFLKAEDPSLAEISIEELADGGNTVTVNGFKMPKYYYSLYLRPQSDSYKIKLFNKVQRIENAARAEVHRLAGKVVTEMYLNGKSLGEVLASEGISEKEIDSVFDKYTTGQDKELEREKAKLKADINNKDYSAFAAYEGFEKYKESKFDKMLNGAFIWFPSRWTGYEEGHRKYNIQKEYARKLNYANIHNNPTFTNLVYLLSETGYNWEKYLLPIVRRIISESKSNDVARQDFETAAMLEELASNLKDNLDIKELTMIARRNTFNQIQEDPFVLANSFLMDMVVYGAIGNVIKAIKLERALAISNKAVKAAQTTVKTAKAANLAKATKVAKTAKTGKVAVKQTPQVERILKKIRPEYSKNYPGFNRSPVARRANPNVQKVKDITANPVQLPKDFVPASTVAEPVAKTEKPGKIRRVFNWWLDKNKKVFDFWWNRKWVRSNS